MRYGGEAPPKNRPTLKRLVRGEMCCGYHEDRTKEGAGSGQALYVAEQFVEKVLAKGDKSLILTRSVGADFKSPHKAERVFNLR